MTYNNCLLKSKDRNPYTINYWSLITALALGKQWSLGRMANQNGFFKMASLDQRPPIEQPIKQSLIDANALTTAKLNADIVRFKKLLIETFQSRSSVMLLDPTG